MLHWLFTTLHLLALGCGLGAVSSRGRTLSQLQDASGLQRAMRADNWWRLSLWSWLISGIGLIGYSTLLQWPIHRPDPAALAKLLALLMLFLLEWRCRPLMLQCRQRLERGRLPASEVSQRLARNSHTQQWLLLVLLALSTAWQQHVFNAF